MRSKDDLPVLKVLSLLTGTSKLAGVAISLTGLAILLTGLVALRTDPVNSLVSTLLQILEVREGCLRIGLPSDARFTTLFRFLVLMSLFQAFLRTL